MLRLPMIALLCVAVMPAGEKPKRSKSADVWAVVAGTVFREQNIILAAAGEESMPRFHAPKLFMGAASVGIHGVMQADVVLVAAERRLIDRAEEVILLVDSSKFHTNSGTIVCSLDEIDTIITDTAIPEDIMNALVSKGVELIIVE